MATFIPPPDIGGSISQIANAAAHLINPHKGFQDAVLGMIARDPTVARQFADLEAETPGILKKLGIPGLATISPSPEAMFRAQQRPAIIENFIAQLQGEKAKNLDIPAQVASDQKTRPDRESIVHSKAVMDAAQAAVAPNLAEADKAKADLQKFGIDEARKLMANKTPITAEAFMKDQYTPEQLNAIFSSPLGNALIQKIDIYQSELRNQYARTSQTDYLDRMDQAEAFKMFQASGFQGSRDAYLKLMTDPTAATQARELAKKPIDQLTPDEQHLVTALNAMNEMQGNNRAKTLQSYSTAASAILDKFNEYKSMNRPKEALKAQAELLDAAFRRMESVPGGPVLHARYGTIVRKWWPDTEGLIITNAEGVEVPPESIGLPPLNDGRKPLGSPSEQKGGTGTPPKGIDLDYEEIARDYGKIQNPAERTLFLNRIRAQFPDNWLIIRDALGLPPEKK